MILKEQYIHHCLLDSNLFMARDYSTENDYGYNDQALTIKAKNLMIRNNLFYGFLSAMNLYTHPLVGGVENIYVYNNTAITDLENGRFAAISKDSNNIKLYNNIFYNTASELGAGSDSFIKITNTSDVTEFNVSMLSSDNNLFFGEAWNDSSTATVLRVESESSRTLSTWQEESSCDLSSSVQSGDVNTTIDMDTPEASLEAGFGELASSSPANWSRGV